MRMTDQELLEIRQETNRIANEADFTQEEMDIILASGDTAIADAQAKRTAEDYKELLQACRRALFDATWHDDGLDGAIGETLMERITDILQDKKAWREQLRQNTGE